MGAGASLAFGAPSTSRLTSAIEETMGGEWMTMSGGGRAWAEIRQRLGAYLKGGPDAVNFEHIYHCAHELEFAFDPTPGAVNAFRPLLRPFMDRRLDADERALRALCRQITDVIFKRMATVSAAGQGPIAGLSAFIAGLRATATTRIYTTNYDDFPLQAAPDLDVGFERRAAAPAVRFDPRTVFDGWERDCLYHLHGSIHFGFAHPPVADGDIGELFWFDDAAEAVKYAGFSGSGASRMDGSQVQRSAVITGLDKLSRLQAQPMAAYYAALARDAIVADVIYVIGSGLGDLHLNTWLAAARRGPARPPVLIIDKFDDGFMEQSMFEIDAKSTVMWHSLNMNIGYRPGNGVDLANGWTLAADLNSAVWDRGFEEFLADPSAHTQALHRLAEGPLAGKGLG
jgi:hypothetical protein